jgi:putative exporter of polyketide antibiotics
LRATGFRIAVYAVVIWSLIADLLSSIVTQFAWLDYLSLFRYMALAPAQTADSATVVITVAIALTLCAIATILFDRRDLQTA